MVLDASKILPLHKKKAKGLAGILEPEPAQEMRGFLGLTPADFEPDDPSQRFGVYRKSAVDGLLAPLEEHADLFAPKPHALEAVDGWYDQLDLAASSRMRRNTRFRRLLEELSQPRKYSAEQKEQFLVALKAGLSHRPDLAGFNSDVAPLSEDDFRSQYVDPHVPWASQMGIRQGA
mmetsp:Transcript_64327/g.176557  ORF Transcript_64327/g.176557 Transcript_64327/m.176557 type:complete len:176 (+) Transcript_64327:3-530(+)